MKSNNIKNQEAIKTENYQYKITNTKTRVSIQIHVRYEWHEKKGLKIKKLMK
jgi:hypothetical protein